jgi:hypothetical protein
MSTFHFIQKFLFYLRHHIIFFHDNVKIVADKVVCIDFHGFKLQWDILQSFLEAMVFNLILFINLTFKYSRMIFREVKRLKFSILIGIGLLTYFDFLLNFQKFIHFFKILLNSNFLNLFRTHLDISFFSKLQNGLN